MKLFKLLKSCTVGFLALALVIGAMGATKVSAAEDDTNVTFQATVGEKTYTYKYKCTADGNISTKTVLSGLKDDKGNAVEGQLFKDVTGSGATKVDADAIKLVAATVSGQTITVTLVPAKLETTFKYGDDFTYKVELENGKKTDVSIDEVAQGLVNASKEKAEKDGELVITSAKVGSGSELVSAGSISIDYSELPATGSAVTVTAEKAFSAVYDTITDTVAVTATHSSIIWFVDAKSEEGTKVPGKTFKSIESKDGKFVIALNDSKKALKVAESKDLYLYITTHKPADAKTDIVPNFNISKSLYSSITVVPNYALAYPGITNVAIASFTCKTNDKQEKSYVTGAEGNTLDLSKLLYSTDNKTWKKVNEEGKSLTATTTISGGAVTVSAATAPDGEYKFIYDGSKWTYGTDKKAVAVAEGKYSVDGLEFMLTVTGTPAKDNEIAVKVSTNALTGEVLYNLCNKDKQKLYFKYEGSVAVTADTQKAPNIRCCKVKSLSVPKVPSLKSVKVDFVKGTVAVKHGFDYFVTGTAISAAPQNLGDWTTVIPYNKKGTATTATIATDAFVPQTKLVENTNEAKYTAIKVKNLVLSDICKNAWDTNGVAFIYVRKSATAKKPASNYVQVGTGKKVVTVAKAVTAPSIAIKEGTSAYAVEPATGKAFTIPKLEKANGDPETRTFEYTIVKVTDWDGGLIDTTSLKWSKLEAGKTIKFTAKSNYLLKGDESKTKQANELSKGECYILVRAAAVKEKAVASEILKTKVVTSGTNLSWEPVTE